MAKRLWQILVVKALRGMLRLARVVPLSILLNIASTLGVLAFHASRRYREVGLKNLRLAYGDALTDSQRREMIQRVFQNFAKSFIAEFPWAAAANAQQIREHAEASPEDMARLMRCFIEKRGAIMLTAHLGNFELLATRLSVDGIKLAVVVRNDRNSVLAQTINSVRERSYETIERGSAARTMLRRAREGFLLAIAPDQKSDELLIPFFGQPSGTVAGPAVIALRSGAPIIPLFCIRQADDRHKIIVCEEIDTRSTGDKDADIVRIMTDVNRVTESIIRQYPDQWLWLHDRWRNTPELVAEWKRKEKSSLISVSGHTARTES